MFTLILGTVLLTTLALAVGLWRGANRLEHLAASPWPTRAPHVTVVVAARNEGTTIEPAVRSMLSQRGLAPESRVIAVNDRSEDDTGAVLDRLATEHDQLIVRHIEALPTGWLGKNHALWTGAQEADGDWLLFTDADVVMGPETIARAAGRAQHQGLQHITAMPSITAQSPLLRIMIIQFAISFLAFFRPWRMAYDASSFAGIGAFNLVDAATYHRVDGHRAIALTPLDDILLGRLLRHGGADARLVFGDDLLRLVWYPDASSMIRAFNKNGFAAFDYRITRLAAATGLYLGVGVLPWLALLIPGATSQLVAGATVAIAIWLQAWFAHQNGWPWHTALLAPVGTTLLIWMWWRAALITLYQGGVSWRGTHYRLAELREHHERLDGRWPRS